MAIHPLVARRRRVYDASIRAATVRPIRAPLIVKCAVFVFVALTTLAIGVIGVSRLQTFRAVIDLPQDILPGSPVPYEADPALHGGMLAHQLTINGFNVQLAYDSEHELIVRAQIAENAYTIGDLILAWGTPSGFARSGRDVDVYWGRRGVYLNTCSFRPDSRVQYIAHYIDEQTASFWRGFSTDTDTDC
jgi:hypothetical protein